MTVTVLWDMCSIVVYAENRLSLLHSRYVQTIEGRGFLPGAQPDGARKVASTISIVQGGDYCSYR